MSEMKALCLDYPLRTIIIAIEEYTILTLEQLKKTDRKMHSVSSALVSDPLKVEMHRQ